MNADTFSCRGRTVTIDRTAVMGIVNASPESFSGDGSTVVDDQATVAVEQFAAGALIVDVGGQSANTKTPELDPAEEIDRVVPLVEAIRARHDGLISVDTYKPAVADAALTAGADIINDVSALWDPGLAGVIADHGAGLVLMHTEGPPKVKILERDRYDDVVSAVLAFADRTLALLEREGVGAEQVMFDPGVDFAKTPRQSIDLLARASEFAAVGRPLLFALSRKDFIGALTSTPPRQRDPGTLASVGVVADALANSVVRVHDVAGTVQYLAVHHALRHADSVSNELHLSEDLRRT